MSIQSYEEYLDNNRFYFNSELKNINNNFGSSLILKKIEDFKRYFPNNQTKENILIINSNGSEKRISIFLIKDLLEDEGMYRYLLLNIDNDSGIVAKLIFMDSKECHSIELSRVELVIALSKIEEYYSENINVNVKIGMRIALLKSFATEESFIARFQYNKEIFEIEINKIKVSMPIHYLTNLLIIGNEECFLNELDKNEYGYAKEIICYSLVQYVETYRILYKYILSKKVQELYARLKKGEIVSYENINKSDVTSKSELEFSNEVHIPEYIVEILENFPHKNYSPLMVAMYTFLELSQSYSTHLQKEEKTIDNFILIYAKIIKHLGINFTIRKKCMTFSLGEFTCLIESLDKITYNDILCTKISGKYLALKSSSSIAISNNKFNELANKVYADYINDKKKEIEFENNIIKYKSEFSIPILSENSQIELFLRAIARKDLIGLDIIEYIKNTFNLIFNNDRNVKVDFLLPLKTSNMFSTTPVVLVTIGNDKIKYIIIDKNRENIKEISKKEINDLLKNDYYFISSHNKIKVGE